MIDTATLTSLGAALTGVKTIVEIARNVTDAELRQQLNGKIADLQGDIIAARTQSIELIDKYESALNQIRELRTRLDEKQQEQFLHGVWWHTFTVRKIEFDPEAGEDVPHEDVRYEGPYCPLCKEKDGKWIHLKQTGSKSSKGDPEYVCEIHTTFYDVPWVND